ncbi:hypothetical protein EYR40_010512 [Pleurotus pulmonarius]|nr:hypothetical protein EYR36_010099 [Pleurotus pulmonarius]KAF4588956.1 hypothetical protein EYR40_010512 [Pleurotus pulmonarius]
MSSQGRVQQVVVTNNATFDGTVYVFKNAGTYYLLGTIRVGERKTFPINVVQSGINNGDDIRARILSTQGADNTDSVLVTYVSNSGNQAEYIVSGTAGDPKINFTAIAPMTGGPSPPPELRRVRQVTVTNRATFDGTVYIFKNAGTYYLLGPIRVGETQTFQINAAQSGVNNGDDIRTRILSSQGADNTDGTLVTYVSNANFEARYIVDGTAGDPKIQFVLANALVPQSFLGLPKRHK